MFYLRFIILSLGIVSQAENRTFSNSGLLLDSKLTGCACFKSKVSLHRMWHVCFSSLEVSSMYEASSS